MQKNIKFEDFLEKELKNFDFKAGFEKENTKLVNSVIKNLSNNTYIALDSDKNRH